MDKGISASDREILEYDWEALERKISQHEDNVASFQEAIQKENMQIIVTREIMKRKSELEKQE